MAASSRHRGEEKRLSACTRLRASAGDARRLVSQKSANERRGSALLLASEAPGGEDAGRQKPRSKGHNDEDQEEKNPFLDLVERDRNTKKY